MTMTMAEATIMYDWSPGLYHWFKFSVSVQRFMSAHWFEWFIVLGRRESHTAMLV
jgi:hypothetical protein